MAAASLAFVLRGRADASARRAVAARIDLELKRVAFQAQNIADQRPDLALLLAAEAYRRRPDTTSEGALEAVLATMRAPTSFVSLDLPAGFPRIAATPDGRLLVVARGGVALVVDGATLRPTGTRIPVSASPTLALRPDGGELAIVSETGEVRRVDPANGAEVAPIRSVRTLTGLPWGAPAVYLPRGRLAVGDGGDLLVLAARSGDVERTVTTGVEIVSLYRRRNR